MAASNDHLTGLLNIRNYWRKVIEDELARVQAITAAGHPPPTTYSSGGKNYDWNGWYNMAIDTLDKWNKLVIAAGGDGGIPEETVRYYS